ncbi:hypothetical protein F4777DRAFT_600367 [Nemania sp. FL0916]|nr:hypothetical protein F4777DRAFT_600367 [Nemania sp. FL0916]
MASEEPQSLSLEVKPADHVSSDEMDIDKPAVKMVNGCREPDHDSAQPTVAPGTTEEIQKSAQSVGQEKITQNHQAFTSNHNAPDSSAPKSIPNASSVEDTEMSDVNEVKAVNEVNGTTEAEEKQSEDKADEIAITSTVAPPIAAPENPDRIDKEPEDSAAASLADPKAPQIGSSANGPILDGKAESMDIDVSIDRPDPSPSAEQTDSIQNASTVSDAPVASSFDSSQPADLSKLEIKATQEEESNSIPTAGDVEMSIESIASPGKVPREREEDDDEEPAAKRAKTEDATGATADSVVVASGDEPNVSTQAQAEAPDSVIPDSSPIASHQNKRIREVLGNVKKTKSGAHFRKSVEDLWPNLWNEYRGKVDNPIDIMLMEAKLRENKYATYGEFKADITLLYENALAFNGPSHDVTGYAAQVRDYILVRMPDIMQTKAPTKPEKGKAQPTRHTEPRAATQPRRQSNSQAQAPATSPKQKTELSSTTAATANAGPAFALPPSGIPQIRRDSTREDNRPKRPINPPKNRDPEYVTKTNRKKKLAPDQRFFDTVLEEIKKDKYFSFNTWFLTPVDPVALNIPDYFKTIKKPMDLQKMTEKNLDGEYKTTKDLEKDMKLIVQNSISFNGPNHEVTSHARQLEELLKSQLAESAKWMERNYPAASSTVHAPAASPERSIDESDDGSDGDSDGEDDDNGIVNSLQQRWNEEQEKLGRMLSAKKPDLGVIEVQQSLINFIQKKLLDEKNKSASDKKPKKKKAAGAKAKAKAGGPNTLGGNKRLSGAGGTSKKPTNSSKKPSAPKKRTIGPLEKAVIAEGINELDGATLAKAVEIIKRDTGQNENDEGEMELDIDSLSQEALTRLYDLINKAHPSIRQKVAQKPEHSSAVVSESEPKARPGALPKAKKNKPMNKIEQERKIEQLRELKAQLQRAGSGSQEPIPEAEAPAAAESSEESDSEEE